MGGVKLFSVVGSLSAIGLAQDYFLEKRDQDYYPPEVQCTYTNDTCTMNTCCEGSDETGGRRYPCPTSLPGFSCGFNSVPKPISCGKMTSFGKLVCELERHCKWQEWKMDFATGTGNVTRYDGASCVFSKRFSETCYPPPHTPHFPLCFSVVETNSGWPNTGMDWHRGRNWTQLQAHPLALRAAETLGWNGSTWEMLNVASRGAYIVTDNFPASTFTYWPSLTRTEKVAAHVLGWNAELWNYNVMAMIGAHTYKHCWPPVVYKQWVELTEIEQEGMQGLGWIGEIGANYSTHVNHVFWEDAGDQKHGWPASQCQDWDHVNQTAVYQVFAGVPDCEPIIPEVWSFYFRTLDPICPVSNPPSQ